MPIGTSAGVLLLLLFHVFGIGGFTASEEAGFVMAVVVHGRIGPVSGLAFGHHGFTHGLARIHHFVVLATAFRVGAALRTAVLFLQSQVDASCAKLGAVEHFRARSNGRIPIEFHGSRTLADAYFVARLGSLIAQLVFDTEFGEAVGQVADCFVVVEVGFA